MKLLNTLRGKGYRITSQRRKVFDSFGKNPLTAERIFHQLSKNNIKIDLSSIYRSLLLFAKEDIVREVDFGDGKKRYELVKDEKHHHHLVCNNCGNIEDIYLEKEVTLLKEVNAKSDYNIKGHSLEFFGVCKNCQ